MTFSAERAIGRHQEVLYVTERCVFELSPAGLTLTEVAPGIDVETQILSILPFDVIVDSPVAMFAPLLVPGTLGLRDRMLDVRVEDRLTYDADSNTVFMDFSGMHLRTTSDVDQIVAAVDKLLGPLGHRVHSIVNYDRFLADDSIAEGYADAVKYVADKYYLTVSRHATSGFTRLKLGKQFAERHIESALHEMPPAHRD